MSEQILNLIEISLEALGLSLAALDYFGWARWAEQRLDKFKGWLSGVVIILCVSPAYIFNAVFWGGNQQVVSFLDGVSENQIFRIGIQIFSFCVSAVIVMSVLFGRQDGVSYVEQYLSIAFASFMMSIPALPIFILGAIYGLIYIIDKTRQGTFATIGILIALVGFCLELLGVLLFS